MRDGISIVTLKLNPEILRCAYDYLNATEPFVRWNLPDSEDVTFRVAKTRAAHGWHIASRRGHTIAISSGSTGHTTSLMATMAHELIHVHQSANGLPLNHGAAFKKLAAKVCRCHGFDPKTF